ncbi:sulfite exporter TauE/SafE family protein [Priestia flexa]|uniref:sulfite exporter TauE/SafE family protein n=1 Tax=Priestia TaxID=2800373 RepID=UPI00220BEA3D|nr:sulfite exporter TauE/SafE family protein [Priestia flexa]MDT2046052.1 sulfite exporter TauE/SafE family protein [Priestia flexa]USY53914.1 sulfite exporter TauE/SafE family protein [Bacillus sp. 1780r2a1]
MHISIILTMLAVGLILGFVGAGGSGFIISLLTLFFNVPVHIALATALAAMIFSSLSGAISHYREGNVSLKSGIIIGVVGALGAWLGSHFSSFIPEEQLTWLTASMLFLSGVLLWVRTVVLSRKSGNTPIPQGAHFVIASILIGVVTGLLSGMFGIGSTPFIQLGLMMILGLSLHKSAGTTMLIIIPIAIGGGTGYYQQGFLDIQLLFEVVVGTMVGSYIGAKFTNRVPTPVLKTSLVALPIFSGFLLIV